MKRKAIVLLMGICFIMFLSGCGTPKYVGTWYDISDPNDDPIIITEDQMFQCGDIGGTCSESDNGIILVPSTYDDSESLTYSEFEGEFALEDDNGDLWIKDYDKAVEYYNKKEEEEEKQAEKAIEQRKNLIYKTLEGKIEATYKLDDSYSFVESYEDRIQLSDGKYTFTLKTDNGFEKQTGAYKITKAEGTKIVYDREAPDYYYTIDFTPESTTSFLKEITGGKAVLSEAYIEYDDDNGQINLYGNGNNDDSFETDYYISDGPYHSDKSLSDSELESFDY